jgi:hypothetical protein
VTDAEEEQTRVFGVLGVTARTDTPLLSLEEQQVLDALMVRVTRALADRKLQQSVLGSLRYLIPDIEEVQQLRGMVPYAASDSLREPAASLMDPSPIHNPEFEAWVKEALSHYWGGPKLTRSPLIRLRVVSELLSEAEDDPTKALRLVLGQAMERLRPEGKQNFTAPEWLLYNILEMRFIQGRKVREIADRLAMSESDLYRKQRVAIGQLARVLTEMEQENALTIEATPAAAIEQAVVGAPSEFSREASPGASPDAALGSAAEVVRPPAAPPSDPTSPAGQSTAVSHDNHGHNGRHARKRA